MVENKKIKVVIVDDSAFLRKVLASVLGSDPEIEIVGTAADPYIAREVIKNTNPDVITLDIEMPKMDGLTFLEKIMSLRPIPVIMVSSLTQKGASETIRALELGAIDYVGKVIGDEGAGIEKMAADLISKVKIASRAKVRPAKYGFFDESKLKPLETSNTFDPSNSVIAIGSSTGGVEAIKEILPLFPENSPPILITQHMPKEFTASFADRLNNCSVVSVYEAKDRQAIEPGSAYIAPGGIHLKLALNRAGHGYYCSLDDGEKVSGHKPSVDALFSSVADAAGKRAIGVILTGMGRDGSLGMLEMKKAGAYNIGQDEESCVVYGMPKAAYMAGAVDEQVSLTKITDAVLKKCGARN
jgi:two-component system chemotaxis response regulator CheB